MRPYRSPLHIIPRAQLNQPEQINLRMLRREIMLRLELAGGTTLEINGRSYDKNTVLAAIEALQTDLALHLQLYQNEPLLEFVENGDPAFFGQPEAWRALEYPVFAYWLKPYFTYQYSNLLYDCVSSRSFQSVNQLQQIRESGFSLPAIYRDEAHHKTFTYLQSLIREARQRYPAPFSQEKRKKVIDPGVEEYINPHYYGVFQQLDDDFYPVIQEFGRYSHRLLAMAFPTKTRLRTLSRPTLHTLHEAARIAMLTNDDPSIASINRTLRSYLYSSRTSTEEPSWTSWLKIGGFIAYLLFMALMHMDGCNDRPQPYTVDLSPLITDLNVSNLPLTDDFLIGHWQAHFWQENGQFIRHDWIFKAGGEGQTIYSLLLSGLKDTCALSYDFRWQLGYETIEGKRYSRLAIEAPQLPAPNACLTTRLPFRAQIIYDRVVEELQAESLTDSCYLTAGLHVNLGSVRSFKVVNSGQIYREVQAPDNTKGLETGADQPTERFEDIMLMQENE